MAKRRVAIPGMFVYVNLKAAGRATTAIARRCPTNADARRKDGASGRNA